MPIVSPRTAAHAAGRVLAVVAAGSRRSAGGGNAVRRLSVRSIADRYDTFVFDCDGVLWKGDSLIPGADAVLGELRTRGKNAFFMTNNSLKTREECVAKFEHFNIPIDKDHMFCSAFAAALYLRSKGFSNSNKKVYVIGEGSVATELSLMGIQAIGGADFAGTHADISHDFQVEVDPDVAAVVVGCDREISYYKLIYAQLCLLHRPECLFIATNRDMVKHLTPAQEYVGAGAMVNAVSVSTNRVPIVTGKPNPYMIDYIIDRYGLSRAGMCMVGDRLDTDIQFGISAGIDTCLTLSGCTERSEVEHPRCIVQPDYIVNSVADLIT